MDQTWLKLKVRGSAMLAAIMSAWSTLTEPGRQSHIGEFAVSLEGDVRRFKHGQNAFTLFIDNCSRVFLGS
jgi:hypothetical protein